MQRFIPVLGIPLHRHGENAAAQFLQRAKIFRCKDHVGRRGNAQRRGARCGMRKPLREPLADFFALFCRFGAAQAGQQCEVVVFRAEGKMRHHAQRIQQRHAAEGEILRRPHGKERGQLQHQVCAAAQRRLRARPFVQTGGFAALHERARHRADEKICVCQLLCTRKLVRMTVMKRVVFANDAANLHFLLFSFSKAGKRAIITIGISGS